MYAVRRADCDTSVSSEKKDWINRIYHPSSIQTEKSQPEDKGIMPETRFTEFPALSVDPRDGISWSALETDD